MWHGQENCNPSMKTFFGSGDEHIRLTTITTRVEMERDLRERNNLEESLDPMAIRVKRVVHWCAD